MRRIKMYLCKSTRKNSKSIVKEISLAKGEKLTKENIFEFVDFIQTNKKYHPIIRYVVWDDNFCLSNWNTGYYVTIEQGINCLYYYATYLNKKEFPFLLRELHNDKNIRYYINKYYNS